MTEFNLSEKIMKGGNYDYDGSSLIFTKDVKEFIRLLKQSFVDFEIANGFSIVPLYKRLNELAGEKFLK